MGEGWHNTHHAFPTSARHGLRWWQPDVSYSVIRLLWLLGLARNVKLPTKEAQARERRKGGDGPGTAAPAAGLVAVTFRRAAGVSRMVRPGPAGLRRPLAHCGSGS